MAKKPNKWIAGVIAFFSPPLGLLYVAKPRWAFVYLLVIVLVAAAFILVGRFPYIALLVPLITLIGMVQTFLAASRYPDSLPRPTYSKWYSLLGFLILFFAIVFVVRAFLFEPFRVASGSMLPTLKAGKHVIAKKWGYGDKSTFGITLRRGSVSARIDRGDVLVFVYPAASKRMDFLMRVVGLPGDLVEYQKKALTINGKPTVYRNAGTYDFTRHDSSHVAATVRAEKIGAVEYQVMIIPDSPVIHSESINEFPNKQNCEFNDEGFSCRVPNKHYFMLGDNRDASNDSRYWGFVPEDHLVGKVINLPK